jgi:GNAT superfamily N-acetyltransferase
LIRNYQPDDAAAIAHILRLPGGHHMSGNEEQTTADMARDCGAGKAVVYDENGIQAFALVEDYGRISQVFLYTRPNQRGRGIGSQLYEEAMRILAPIDPNTIWFFYRADVGHSRDFFVSKGCQVWYSYHHMAYDGPAFAEPALEACCFDERYFDAYLQARSDAFYELRKALGFVPFAESEKRERLLKYALENRDDIYLFFDQGRFVGSVAIAGGNLLDDVFVAPAEHGKGYGRAITEYAVNRILARGVRPELAVVTVNERAKHLYDRVGFKLLQTLEMSRRFSPNKEPDLSAPGA